MKLMQNLIAGIPLILLLAGCQQSDSEPAGSEMQRPVAESIDVIETAPEAAEDPHLWLEEVLGEESLA